MAVSTPSTCGVIRGDAFKNEVINERHFTLLLAAQEQHKKLLSTTLGYTELAEHCIQTTGTPVKVPPCRIPISYRVEVEEQIQALLKESIIEESSNLWMYPAVFVRKKNGDVRIIYYA